MYNLKYKKKFIVTDIKYDKVFGYTWAFSGNQAIHNVKYKKHITHYYLRAEEIRNV